MSLSALAELARAHGVLTSYRGHDGRTRRAGAESLLAVLQALGVPVDSPAQATAVLRHHRAEQGALAGAPAAVAWNGRLRRWPLRRVPARLQWRIRFEEGGECRGELPQPPPRLPYGVHTLFLEGRGVAHAAALLSAPRSAHAPPGERAWGVFLPLYSLHRRGRACGDYGDLAELGRFVQALGGACVGTLPLLPAFLDRPCEWSPYMPVSRLHWNEAYVRVPGGDAPERERDWLDWPELWRRRRGALQRALQRLPQGERAAFARFEAERPELEDYARFRAVVERRGAGWSAWPGRLRAGTLRRGDYDPETARLYRYAQWRAQQQIAAAREQAGLYLDLPLGVHPDGYDVWRHRPAFATGVRGGAPPDPLAPQGQDWGFPPLHPQRLRADGYRYWRACLEHHMRAAQVLRIDHAPGLHRMYWIPAGLTAADGVYVRYPAEELYALLCLASHRHGTRLVGEDLGTVPAQLRPALRRHRVARTYVLPFELGRGGAARPVPPDAAACLNTHDMPPFAAFWRDFPSRRGLRAFLRRRGARPGPVLRACLQWLAAGRGALVLVNLEDLWGETRPQNVPGTGPERPNWRRRARLPLEQIVRDARVRRALLGVAAARRSARA